MFGDFPFGYFFHDLPPLSSRLPNNGRGRISGGEWRAHKPMRARLLYETVPVKRSRAGRPDISTGSFVPTCDRPSPDATLLFRGVPLGFTPVRIALPRLSTAPYILISRSYPCYTRPWSVTCGYPSDSLTVKAAPYDSYRIRLKSA